ncbi:hypothetical protein CW751_01610 [Brumimicrobium salinarum]|uniref:Uncharacterized protein n=1 Tax=Brumimicrobium salinarum TaxID=2058658 RepID=A0A2I0R6R5_9FLAO|nr:hypothetical protein [Brumimicrobium salinarum]PKR82060.1 hypothetical protein CW751_01610 [Brumimicrobium salinarum]
MKNLIFITLLFFFGVSCKKETSVVIQAKDYNTGDGTAYAGQEYAVAESWTPFQETKSKIVATGFLDANGQASFNLKMKNNRKYVLGVSEPDNICYGGLVQHYLEHEKNNLVDFEYLACGYINLPRVNTNCEGPNDKFRYKYYYTDDKDIYIYTGYIDANYNWQENKFLEGCIDYSNAVSYNSRPVGNYTIEWMVERTSGTTTGIDNFTITENDSLTYLIEY